AGLRCDADRPPQQRAAAAKISLARPVLRVAGDSFLCRFDPPAGPRALGLLKLSDRRDRFTRDEMDGGRHRRRAADPRLQPAVPLCAWAAVPALPALPDPVRVRWPILFTISPS